MVNMIFTDEERRQFKFIFSQEKAFDTRIPRPDIADGKANVLLKDFRVIWNQFGDLYDATNTILIDDSPVKAFANPPNSALFPSPYAHSPVQDDFLMTILLPCLGKLWRVVDVTCYLRLNTPKWSLRNVQKDRQTNVAVYAQLQRFKDKIWHFRNPYTVLDLTPAEIPWYIKFSIWKLNSLDKMDDTQVKSIADICMGQHYSGPYRGDPHEFVKDLLTMKENTSEFKMRDDKRVCNRDRLVDRGGAKLTCSNVNCLDH
jgi:hypothetical protein